MIKYENGHRQCCKCNHSNQNDSGYCTNMMQGGHCSGTPISKKKSWAGCFGVCDSHYFFIGLISAKILTKCKLNPPKLTQTWKCQNCTLANEMDKKNCTACMEIRPTFPPADGDKQVKTMKKKRDESPSLGAPPRTN